MTNAASARQAPSLVRRIGQRLEIRMLGLALVVAVGLSVISPYFLTQTNIFNILDQSVVVGIVAVGMTFVILTGGIDLSVGSVAGLTGVILGLSLHHFPIVVAIPLAIVAGGAIGLFSGILIAYFGLAAFVVTLGVMAIGRSLAYIFSGQTAISDIPDALSNIVYTSVLGIPSNVLLYSIIPYFLSGALSAVAITFSIAQLLSVDPLAGNMLELDAIAAVVIGGASLFGGRGSIIGTLFGVLIMVMIRNGLNLMGVSPFWQGSAIGGIIITALLVERLVSARSAR
jgi:ribose transport system permease protein